MGMTTQLVIGHRSSLTMRIPRMVVGQTKRLLGFQAPMAHCAHLLARAGLVHRKCQMESQRSPIVSCRWVQQNVVFCCATSTAIAEEMHRASLCGARPECAHMMTTQLVLGHRSSLTTRIPRLVVGQTKRQLGSQAPKARSAHPLARAGLVRQKCQMESQRSPTVG